MLKKILIVAFWFMVQGSGFMVAFAQDSDSITIVTYYPSPYGVYREMRAQRMAIGEDYINAATVCWSGDTNCPGGGIPTGPFDPDIDLVVKGNVGIGTPTPQAKLDVSSTTSAFLPPRMSGTDRDNIDPKVRGMLIYNNSTDTMEYWGGLNWKPVFEATQCEIKHPFNSGEIPDDNVTHIIDVPASCMYPNICYIIISRYEGSASQWNRMKSGMYTQRSNGLWIMEGWDGDKGPNFNGQGDENILDITDGNIKLKDDYPGADGEMNASQWTYRDTGPGSAGELTVCRN